MEEKSRQRDCGFLPIRTIRVDMLSIGGYQRRESKKQAVAISKQFIPAIYDPILVGERKDGSFWVVDGQARVGVARLLGFESIECRIFESKGPEHEAEMFKISNTNRRAMKIYDVYIASLFMKHPETVEIDTLVKKHGFQVKYKRRWPFIMSIERLEKAYRKGVLNEVLGLITKTWERDAEALKGLCIGGVTEFLCVLSDSDIDLERCAKKWKHLSPSTFAAEANAIYRPLGNRYRAIALLLTQEYNKGLRKEGKRLVWSGKALSEEE